MPRLTILFLTALLPALLIGACRDHDQRGDGAATTAPDSAAPETPPPDRAASVGRADSLMYAQARSAPLQEPSRSVEAPDFTLPVLGGGTFTLSEHRGKVVVLNFWATWCGPCRHEIPDFIQLHRALGDEGVLFVGVSIDEEGEAVVAPFAEELDIPYPILLDDGTAEGLYGPLNVLPTTYIIGRDGILKRYAPGMLTADALRPVLVDLL